MSTTYENISEDLIWQVVRNNNAYLVKRTQAGGVQLSRDPLNLVNKHARKYEGFVNSEAIGIKGNSNKIRLTTKQSSGVNKPAKSTRTSTFSASVPNRNLYRNVVNSTAKKGYRSDLRSEAVARASAVKNSQRQRKEQPAAKPRGAKAKKAAEKSESA